MQIEIAHHVQFVHLQTRQVRQPSSCFDWDSSFVLQVRQLIRNCMKDKEATMCSKLGKKISWCVISFSELLLSAKKESLGYKLMDEAKMS